MLKAHTPSVAAFLVSLSLATAPAHAVTIQTLTFDDFNAGSTDNNPLPNGYQGLDWNNFYVLNPDNIYQGSGYGNNRISYPNVAFNGYGQPANFSANSPFTLFGGYFGSAWQNETLTAIGKLNGVQEDTMTFNVNTQNPQLIAFNWSGINEVDFSTADGTQFVLDNLEIAESQVAPTPLPGSLVMFATALAGLASLVGLNRRRAGRIQ
jgi:hypothetical protein